MAAIARKETPLKLQFVANTDHSIHAGPGSAPRL